MKTSVSICLLFCSTLTLASENANFTKIADPNRNLNEPATTEPATPLPAIPPIQNLQALARPTENLITLSWENPAKIAAVLILQSPNPPEFTPVNGQTYPVGQTLAGATVVLQSLLTEFTARNLQQPQQAFFQIFTRDSAQNYSGPTTISAKLETPPPLRISEVAWMGTLNSPNAEWIELHNTGETPWDLTGTKLIALDGEPQIELSGVIPARAFWLLERSSDNTLPQLPADQIYTGGLSNKGEHLILLSPHNLVIHEIAQAQGWLAGQRKPPKTFAFSPNQTFVNSLETGGTPKAANFPTQTTEPATPLPAIPPIQNLQALARPTENLITLSWENPAKIAAVLILQSPNPPEFTPVNGQTYPVGQTLAGATVVLQSLLTEFTARNLQQPQQAFFQIFTRDSAQNYSGPTTISAKLETPPPLRISEVAWMGTLNSPNAEWIELHNTGETPWDLTGTKLIALDGEPQIELSGVIPARAFWLLERSSDNTLPQLPADQIYTGGLSNKGEHLILLSPHNLVIHEIAQAQGWLAGQRKPPKTLAFSPNQTFLNSLETGGTPKAPNFPTADLPTVPSNAVLLISEIDFKNPAGDALEIYVVDDGNSGAGIDLDGFQLTADSVFKTFNPNTLLKTGDFLMLHFNSPKPDENLATNHLLRTFTRHSGLTSTTEQISLLKPTGEIADAVAWDDGSPPAAEIIELQNLQNSGAFTGEPFFAPNLKNGKTLTRRRTENGLIDTNTRTDFLARNGTLGAQNLINTPPNALLEIQGRGKTSGTCRLFVNLTAENSSDPEGDQLEFFWDFGNHTTSTLPNPAGFYFAPGNFSVTLTVRDPLQAVSRVRQNFQIRPCRRSAGSRSSTTSRVARRAPNPEPVFASLPASAVVIQISEVSFNSKQDFVEIYVVDDGHKGLGADLGGFSFWSDQKIKTLPRQTILRSGEFLVLFFKSQENDNPTKAKIFTPIPGLTATDEQVVFRDSTGAIEDAVTWDNRDGKITQSETKDFSQIRAAGEWTGKNLDSSKLPREAVFARQSSQPDSNSARDFFLTPFATPGQLNPLPPSNPPPQLLFTRLAPQNPHSQDLIEIKCLTCTATGTNLSNLFVTFNGKRIFNFPREFQLKTNETVELLFKNENFTQKGPQFFLSEQGLTGTDGLLTIQTYQHNLLDFVGWSDRRGTQKRKTDLNPQQAKQLREMFVAKMWHSAQAESLLDSRKLAAGKLFVRQNSLDTNSAQDFIIAEKIKLTEKIQEKFSSNLKFSEVFSNPVGPEKPHEWFELINFENQQVELLGCEVSSGKSRFQFSTSTILAPDERKAFFGLIPLKNSGDTLELRAPTGQIIDQLRFPRLAENTAFVKTAQNNFLVTEIPTPNSPNSFWQNLPKELDSDHDGLNAELEQKFKTNPLAFDTDRDQLPDAFEIYNGRDPLNPDATETARQQYRQELQTLSLKDLKKAVQPEIGFHLAGTGIPGSQVRLYIHSQLKIVELPVNSKGTWQYQPEQPLEAGEHTVFLQLLDPNGFSSRSTKILTFHLAQAFQPPHYNEEIFISEVLPNPIGPDRAAEFIELFNPTPKFADLSNFKILSNGKTFPIPPQTILGPTAFQTFYSAETNLQLPNTGGKVELRTPTNRKINELNYGKARPGRAFARIQNQISETLSPTPKTVNKITNPPRPRSKNKNGNLSQAIQISEVFPNPAQQTEPEFVELWNSGKTPVNLGNWLIRDAQTKGKKLPDSFSLAPGEYRVLPPKSHVRLNNHGLERVEIRDFRGQLIDSVEFSDLPKDRALARDPQGVWRETTLVTPNATNEFHAELLIGKIQHCTLTGFTLAQPAPLFIKFDAPEDQRLLCALSQTNPEWEITAIPTEQGFIFDGFRARKNFQNSVLIKLNLPKINWPLISLGIFTCLVLSLILGKPLSRKISPKN